jgi:hypothetical protein
MPKISAYPDGGALQDTDQLVVNRGGKNFRVVTELTDVIGATLDVAVPASTTYISCPFNQNAPAAGNVTFPWPQDGTLNKMFFRLATNQPATGSLVITLRVNNVDTALVITVPAGSAGGSNFSNIVDEVPITEGDLLAWSFQNNATSASGTLRAIAMILTRN